MDNQIILYGRTPSKKNSRITTRSGRSFPSAKYTEWHKDASFQLSTLKTQFQAFKEGFRGELHIDFYFPDNRRTDLSNKTESIMDLLVDNNWLEDDNWTIVHTLHLKCLGVDKENPRCIISW